MLRYLFCFIIPFLFISTLSYAQDMPEGFDTELEDFLQDEMVEVASIKPLTLRESPGIVTRITAEDIANSGARDLIDILRLVPGFGFAMDVEGVVGIGMRGNWGQEGKVLVLIDNQEINERSYSSIQFGNHFPVDQIQKIEIIRGPGSPLYGGFAELAVIKITTKTAEDLDGFAINGTYGQMANQYARRTVSFAYGKVFQDLRLKASVFMGQGYRSDQIYRDFFGNQYDMTEYSKINPQNVNLALGYKGLDVHFMYDRYELNQKDAFDEILTDPVHDPYDYDFTSYFFGLKYNYDFNEKLSLTTRFNFKRSNPWYYEYYVEALEEAFAVNADHYSGSLRLSYDIQQKMNLIAGFEYHYDQATADTDVEDNIRFENGTKDEISYGTVVGYVQGIFYLPYVNMTIGARYDNHDEYGDSFVPRLALTRVMDKFHAKLLASRAFRAPSIMNIDIEPNIEPEETTVFEIEAGYQFTDKMMLTANAFHLTIDKPIVYFYNEDTQMEGYRNYDQTGTQGVEANYQYKDRWGYANLTYSFYQVTENKVESYAVEDNDDVLLGFPQHKLTFNSHFQVTDKLSINPSFIYYGKRYGYTVEGDDGGVLNEVDPVFLANLYLRCQNRFVEGTEFGLGVYDIFDETYEFIQPYNSDHAPMPGPSREFIIRAGYHF